MRNRLIFDRFPINYPLDGRKVTCGEQVHEVIYDDGDAKYVLHYRLTCQARDVSGGRQFEPSPTYCRITTATAASERGARP